MRGMNDAVHRPERGPVSALIDVNAYGRRGATSDQRLPIHVESSTSLSNGVVMYPCPAERTRAR